VKSRKGFGDLKGRERREKTIKSGVEHPSVKKTECLSKGE